MGDFYSKNMWISVWSVNTKFSVVFMGKVKKKHNTFDTVLQIRYFWESKANEENDVFFWSCVVNTVFVM